MLNEIINKGKSLNIDNGLQTEIKSLSKGLESSVEKAIDKVAGIVIKSLPLPDFAKDILKDIKDTLKRGDIKQVFGTVVNSSIREGMEILGLGGKDVKDVIKLKDVALKGGLVVNMKNAIDIVGKEYIDKNLVGNNTYNFFNELKQLVQSGEFINKLEIVLKGFEQKKKRFFDQVNLWKNFYENSDVDGMTRVALNLKRKKEVISQYPECAKENAIIQNIMSMTNNKNEKLSQLQLQLCNIL